MLATWSGPIEQNDQLVSLARSLMLRSEQGTTPWHPLGDHTFGTAFGAGRVEITNIDIDGRRVVGLNVFGNDEVLVANVSTLDTTPEEAKVLERLFETVRRLSLNADEVLGEIFFELGSPWGPPVPN